MKGRGGKEEINNFHFFQLVDLDSGFAWLLLIDLGRSEPHVKSLRGGVKKAHILGGGVNPLPVRYKNNIPIIKKGGRGGCQSSYTL